MRAQLENRTYGLGSLPPNASAAMRLQQVERDRSSEDRAKSLILYHVAQCVVFGKSGAVVRAFGGEI
jgi:hypothetical protein